MAAKDKKEHRTSVFEYIRQERAQQPTLTELINAHRAHLETHSISAKPKSTGKPMFTAADLSTTANPLAKLIRMVLIKLDINQTEFYDEYYEKFARSKGRTANQISTDKHNCSTALRKSTLTMQKFLEIMDILEYSLEDLEFTMKNRTTGNVITFKLSDATQYEIMQYFAAKKNQNTCDDVAEYYPSEGDSDDDE